MRTFFIKLLLYMGRWQLSTPFMSLVILAAKNIGVVTDWKEVALANLICAPPFFFVDKFIIVHLDKWLRKLLEEQRE